MKIEQIDERDKWWFDKYMPYGTTITVIPKEDVVKVEDFEGDL